MHNDTYAVHKMQLIMQVVAHQPCTPVVDIDPGMDTE